MAIERCENHRVQPRLTGMRALGLCVWMAVLGAGAIAQGQPGTATPESGSPPTGVAGAPAPPPSAAPPATAPGQPPPSTPTPTPAPPAVPAPVPEIAPAPEAAPPVAPAPATPEPAPQPEPPPPAVTPPPPAPIAAAERPQRAPRPPAVEREADEIRADWLYVRIGAGVGFPFGPDIADVYEGRNEQELQFSGTSFALDFMAGRAVLPWLILGLGATSDSVLSGTVKNESQDERDLHDSLYFAVIGGFVDVYTSPPAGLHFQALLGLAHLSQSEDLGQNTGNGFGAVLGVGYEFAVGQRWNLGVLGRMAFSSLSMDAVDGEEPSPSIYEPSLLWTATFRPE